MKQATIIGLIAVLLVFGSAAWLNNPQTVRAQSATACTPAVTEGADESVAMTLEVDGLTRRYLLYVPTTYDPSQAAPLVLSLHGFASNPTQQESFSLWNALAELHGFVVAYPSGTGLLPRWNAGNFNSELFGNEDDVSFFRALVSHLIESQCVDSSRVYVNGLSNGGGMSHRLACEAADVFAAVGTVAGAYGALDCQPARPVPIIAFHGTADAIVPIEGTDDFGLPRIRDWVAEWADRNGCPSTPAELEPIGAVSGFQYAPCDDGVEVLYYEIDGGGHTWPGGGVAFGAVMGAWNMDINASAAMWEFFSRYSLPESDPAA